MIFKGCRVYLIRVIALGVHEDTGRVEQFCSTKALWGTVSVPSVKHKKHSMTDFCIRVFGHKSHTQLIAYLDVFVLHTGM